MKKFLVVIREVVDYSIEVDAESKVAAQVAALDIMANDDVRKYFDGVQEQSVYGITAL